MEIKHYISKIMSSDNEAKKEELLDFLCEIFESMDEEYEEEIERKMYEILEGKVLNEEKARHIIEHMKPFGMKWELTDTEAVRNNYGFADLRPVDFWIVMNSAWNDYNDIFKDNIEMYARFSKDFIIDEDAHEDKVYYYFSMIPKDR